MPPPHGGRPAGVLVEVQPQDPGGRGGAIVSGGHPIRTSIDRAWASRPSARASVTTVGASRASRLLGQPLHAAGAHEVGRAQAASMSGRAAGRQDVIRAGRVVARGLRRVAPDEDRACARTAAADGRRRIPDVPARTGWPGRWLPRVAGHDGARRSRERVARGPVAGNWPRLRSRRPTRSARLHVMRIARASGRAPPAPSGRPRPIADCRCSRGSTISLGPARKSIEQSPATWSLAAATYALPGPTILSTAGTDSVP